MFALQNHRHARLAAAAALVLLAACSSDDDPTGPGTPEPVPTTTLNLAPEGGAWLVTADDGTELTVTMGMAFSQLGTANFSGTVNDTRTGMSGTYTRGTVSGAWTASKAGS